MKLKSAGCIWIHDHVLLMPEAALVTRFLKTMQNPHLAA